MHEEYKIDPENGVVYGKRGRPCTHHNPQGYIQIRKKDRYYAMAHRMIWERVNGPIPDGMQVNHRNGIKWDNRISNLELVTPSENARHAYAIGLVRADGVHNGRYQHGRSVGRFAAEQRGRRVPV